MSSQRAGVDNRESWLFFCFLITASIGLAPLQASSGEPVRDQPRVAIIQYESGRILVVQEVNGELLAVEPEESGSAVLSRYLKLQESPTPRIQDNATAPRESQEPDATEPVFFGPGWYSEPVVINTSPSNDASDVGRAIERSKQNAGEARQQVKARREEQGANSPTNRAGQVYPSTAGDQEELDRLARAQQQGGGTPYVTFYNLGDGLEYFRQQELAARKELTLLTYDALLDDGLKLLSQRRYAQAARSLVAAAQKDQGDAGSRLHAAQCLMACGLYRQALQHVRRAFELAPQLLYRPLDHRKNYPHPEDFDLHLQTLLDYVSSHPGDDDAVMLLAYEQFFGDRPADSAKAMRRVRELSKSDNFARKLWQAAEPVLGMTP